MMNLNSGNISSLNHKRVLETHESEFFVQTEKNEYSPGEQIRGTIYLNLNNFYGPASLKIHFRGHEYALRAKLFLAGANPYYEFFPSKAKLQTTETDIHVWNEIIQIKQYEFPFVLNLDTLLPGSCFIKTWEVLGDISYFVEAKLIPHDAYKPGLQYKHPIWIKQLPLPILNTLPTNNTLETIKTASLEKASTHMKAEINKLVYHPGETVNLKILFDNRKSKTKCKKIIISLKQHLLLKAGVETMRRYKLISREYLGINADIEKEGNMSIVIPEAEKNTLKQLKKSGVTLPNLKKMIIHENRAPLTISPTTYGVLIQSIYFVDIKAMMDTFPTKSFNITFQIQMNAPSKESISFEALKQNWNPIVMKENDIKSFQKMNSPFQLKNNTNVPQDILKLEEIELKKIKSKIGIEDAEKQNLLLYDKDNEHEEFEY